jgi:hypothetical protein
MVYNMQDYWIFGLSPLSGILKNITFQKVDLFPSPNGGGVHTYSVGSLRGQLFQNLMFE